MFDNDRLLTPQDMVDLFPGTTRGSWATRRTEKNGPDFLKIGNRVWYRQSDVEAWMETKVRSGSVA